VGGGCGGAAGALWHEVVPFIWQQIELRSNIQGFHGIEAMGIQSLLMKELELDGLITLDQSGEG
jgi:hypothetical protein